MYQIPYFRRFKKTSKCRRCMKNYPADLPKCSHCQDIPDGKALNDYIAQHQAELRGSSALGLYFVIAALVTACLLLLAQ